ncbi:MAG: prepilin peptidase [Balneolaceae bacterium]|nr:prepilin peptidase [Balneolaceae bacterium]MBO6546182.1 prepilin peptidase [Balneolaceae bacterium]MBO6648540.1 prepilin peptidase [Balneolaceae bacterium]
MLFELSIAIITGAIGSYFCFFNPALLSGNIVELQSTKLKWIATVFSLICSISFLFLVASENHNKWLEVSFFLVLYFISVTDLYSKIIPNKLVFLLLILSAIQLYFHFDAERIVAFGLITVLLIALNLLANKYFGKLLFGWGDVKLIGVLSLSVGWEIVWVVYIALVLGGLLSIIGVLAKKISRNSKIPFVVFLFFGMLILHLEIIGSLFYL